MVTSPRNRYRTRYKVSVEKPRSSELRLSPTRANCNNQADFLSLLGLQKTVPQPKEPTMDNFQLRTCTVVVMCSRCDICKKWFKSSSDAEAHISQCHDEFEMAFAQSAPFKRRNKARRGKSMNKENRTVNVRRTSNRQKPIKHYDLGQFGELSETADTSRYKELPKTVVKKVKKPAVPKPRIIKRPLLLPQTLLQARMPVPMVDNDSDDDIQFCYEVKYNHEPTVQSDDDCAVVCEVVKEKPASITPDPSAPRYFQDPRITSSDSFTGPKMVVHPSQLCAVVTRRDQNNEKVVQSRTKRTEVSSTSRSIPGYYYDGKAQTVKNYGSNSVWERQISTYIQTYKQAAALQRRSLGDSSYDTYMNAGKSDDNKQECDSTDEIIIL